MCKIAMAKIIKDNSWIERMFDSAIAYADMSWPVLPLWSVDEDGRCLCGHKNCTSPGKHPHGKFAPTGYKSATRDGSIIAGWFNGSNGDINIGICTGGESGLIVLDVDPGHGGDKALADLELKHGKIDTLGVITGGGGDHLYLGCPVGKQIKNSVSKLGPGLDIRSDGGYVVAPPSLHISGQEYRWKVDPRARKPIDCPGWLIKTVGSVKGKESGEPIRPEGKPIPAGQRNDTLTSLAGSMRRKGFSQNVIYAAILDTNRKHCDPPLEHTEVEQIASSVAKYAPSDSMNAENGIKEGGRKTQATMLVDLAKNAELFHNPDSDAFATISINGHRETWRLKSQGFRRWLTGQFWKKYGKAHNSQALQNAISVLISKALYDGGERLVHVRRAEHDGNIWMDLANHDWQAVKITPDGWEVVNDPPVKFLRPRGLLPLQLPVPGGNINLLRQFINISSEDDWLLLVAWIVAGFWPNGPYPVLAINGEQGSAKSTLCRLLRILIDPNSASIRAMPRDGRDLVIAASNSWVLAYDNISNISTWLSDAFCRIATGGGFATRELYSDNEEVIFDVMKPVILNGISELATRSDLLDRSICITLPTIPDEKRMTEKELFLRFNKLLPQILGAFIDVISKAMKRLPTVKLQKPPRMADFATLAVAAEEALGLKPGAFLSAYSTNRGQASDLAIEASAVGPAILAFIEEQQCWEGTAAELQTTLENRYCSEQTKNRRDWPKTPQAVGKALRRIAPNLRQTGIDVRFNRSKGKGRRRLIVLEKLGILSSNMSEESGDTQNRVALNVVSDMSDISDKKIQGDSQGIADIL